MDPTSGLQHKLKVIEVLTEINRCKPQFLGSMRRLEDDILPALKSLAQAKKDGIWARAHKKVDAFLASVESAPTQLERNSETLKAMRAYLN